MSIYQKFGTDKNLETTGVTIDYGDFKITLNRAGGANRAYQKAFAEKFKPYRLMIDAGNMDQDLFNKLLAEIYADTIVTSWDGMTDEKGKKLPYSRENVIKVFTDLPDFFNKIIKEADDIANFRKEEMAAEAKNSVKS